VIQSTSITVTFERRDDGGLRVYSDEVPGFLLNHPNADAVIADVAPALEVILSAMWKTNVTVVPPKHIEHLLQGAIVKEEIETRFAVA
jgi:hypothetical protein